MPTVIYDILNKRAPLSLLMFVSLILFMGVTGIFVSDMYVPALPAMTHELLTNSTFMQFSISIYVLTLALSQLIYGPLSDRFGRRKIIITGLLISLLGTGICIFSGSINHLLIGRFIQGLGIGAPLCSSRSLSRDVFNDEQMAKFGSYFSLVFALAPAIAPILGGYCFHYYGWRSIFIFIAAYTAIISFLIWRYLPETRRIENKVSITTKAVLKNYYRLFSDNEYIAFSISTGVAMSCIIVYFTMSPFLMQNVLHLSAVSYAWLSIYITFALLAGRVANIVLLNYYNAKQTVFIGCLGMLFSSLMMLVLGQLGYLNVAVVIIPMMIIIMSSGLVFSNAMAGALRKFSDIAGSAGALYGCIQIFASFIASAIAAKLHETTQVPMASLLSVITLLGVVVVYYALFQYNGVRTLQQS